jgi:hypothetical protein
LIELPHWAAATSMSPRFLDAGFTQRGVQSLDRIDRKGGRYKFDFTFGPYQAEESREIVSLLIAGKQEGLRVRLPLLHPQGNPGAPLLAGAAVSGRTIALDGVTRGYVCKPGFWLSLVKDGRHYLHNVRTGGQAAADGTLSLTLNELLRDSFADNAAVHLAQPMIEGLVDGDEFAWSVAARERLVPIEFTIEEAR